MIRRWVIDSSPLILLSKIGQVALLHELPDEMVIPAGVAQEIQRGAKNDVARRWLEKETLGCRRRVLLYHLSQHGC